MHMDANQKRPEGFKQAPLKSLRFLRSLASEACLIRAAVANGLHLMLLMPLLLAIPFKAAAQPIAASAPVPTSGSSGTAPQPILPAFGGLSDGGPVLTPYIDRLAFNARADFLILADTPERRQAFAIPYGFSFAALHLIEGGIFTRYVSWKEGERSLSYHAPLGLNIKVRLWRWFAQDPNKHFTVVAAYQHEVRTGPFDGPNQLGLYTDMATVRLAASLPVWLLDIGTSVGVLYDYQGRFAVGELGARLGVRLDFIWLEDTRASIEGIIRGLPSYVRTDAALPSAFDPQKPLGLSGALFFGVNTRMTKTADFGIWAQRGFGDVAALSFGVRILGIFIGEGYMRPQPLWADILKEAAAWIKAQVVAIDPIFREDCIAYDKDEKGADGPPMGHFGRLSEDKKWCVGSDGFRAPVDVDLFRNPKKTLLCWDDEYKDCLLRRVDDRWVPIHRPRLNSDCILIDSDGSWLAKLGEPSPDGRTCHWAPVDQRGRRKEMDLEVGRLYHADSSLRHVCYNEDLSGCFVDRSDHPERWDGHYQAGESLRQGVRELGTKAQKTASVAGAVTSGRVSLMPIAEKAAEDAERAAAHCGKNPLECAKRAWYAAVDKGKEAVQDAKDWWDAPTQDKVNSAMRSLPAAEAGVVVGGVAGAAERVVERGAEKVVAKAVTQKAEKVLAKQAKNAVGKSEAGVIEHAIPAHIPQPERLPGRHGAFHEAKKDIGIPRGQPPDRIDRKILRDPETKGIARDSQGRPIETREYIYTAPDGKTYTIQEHSLGHKFGERGVGDQKPHFNVREYPSEHRTPPNAKAHYPFKAK